MAILKCTCNAPHDKGTQREFCTEQDSYWKQKVQAKGFIICRTELGCTKYQYFYTFYVCGVIGLYLLLPLESVKGLIISLLWILPLSILSQINTRNIYDSTREMIQSTAYFNRMEGSIMLKKDWLWLRFAFYWYRLLFSALEENLRPLNTIFYNHESFITSKNLL